MLGVTGPGGDCLENDIRLKNLNLSLLHAFRIIFKHIIHETDYWGQAFGVLRRIYLEKYRSKIFIALYVFTLVTFWILSGVRAAATKA